MMKKFLLLRSNKQSGPYSAEELQQMGLKAYDLIWVDGKSAAWRYPGEVDELKSFAPPVEEQPYDRFYKKPEEKSQESKADTPPTSVITPQKSEEPVEKQPQKKEKEYKRVFVTLPNGAGAAASRQPSTPKPVAQPPIQAFGETLQPANSYQQPASELPKSNPVKTKAPVEKEAVADEDIYYPKRRSGRLKPLVLAGVITGMVAMVALGIFIGMSIDKKEGFSLIKKVDKVDNPNKQPAPNSNTAVNQASLQPEPLVGEIDNLKQDEAATEAVPPVVKKKTNIPADSNQQEMVVNIPAKSDTENIVEKKEEPVKKPASKPAIPNLEKLVGVSSNDYQVGPFGGISKLELTVKNTSEYDLNLVVVQVEYLKVNKEVFKTENIYFRDIGANSSATLEAPRSNRGNKVNYKITLINSKDHLYHAGN